MKILAVADVESKKFYEYYSPGKLRDYDLILACGDLRVPYLEFLVTMARCPVLYVHGNHDERFSREPEGCECIDDRIFVYQGTEKQMRRRIRRLWWRLHRLKGFDILVTHAPARELGDMENISHRGFECFRDLLERYEPRLFVHGHVHRNYGQDIPQRSQYGKTLIVNAYEYCEIEI